jgi:hypothetical protein
LHARGYQIGTVKYRDAAYDYEQNTDDLIKSLEIFHDWWTLFTKIKGNERAQQLSFLRTLVWGFYQKEGDDLEERLAATLGAFGALSERLLSSSVDPSLGYFNNTFRSFTVRFPQRHYDRTFVQGVAKIMIGRRFFISSSLEAFQAPIGLASAQIEEGDPICILFGCPLPVILHEVDSTGKFVLVGPAYLDGFMHGEAFKILENHPASEVRSWDIV